MLLQFVTNCEVLENNLMKWLTPTKERFELWRNEANQGFFLCFAIILEQSCPSYRMESTFEALTKTQTFRCHRCMQHFLLHSAALLIAPRFSQQKFSPIFWKEWKTSLTYALLTQNLKWEMVMIDRFEYRTRCRQGVCHHIGHSFVEFFQVR